MYEVISGLPPYHDVSHDKNLAMKICLGFRPRFNIKVPQLIVHLIKRCLDANPLNRPTALEIEDILYQWYWDFDKPNEQIELKKQIKEAEEIYNEMIKKYNIIPDEIHITCMIDLFGRSNKLDEAEKYLNLIHQNQNLTILFQLFYYILHIFLLFFLQNQ